jgi:hypothetical protein
MRLGDAARGVPSCPRTPAPGSDDARTRHGSRGAHPLGRRPGRRRGAGEGGYASPATLDDSYARARAIVDAAVAAHGGVDALRAARQMRVTLAGHDVHRNQSKRVAPPYDREPHTVDLMIDLARARLSFARTFAYPGGAWRTQQFISDSARGYVVDRKSRTHRVVTFPPVETQYGNLFYLPQLVLLAARDNPSQLRSIGRVRLSSGAALDAVVAPVSNGLVTLGFDPATRRLRALLSVRGDALAATWPRRRSSSAGGR